jgi:hypothetical protein
MENNKLLDLIPENKTIYLGPIKLTKEGLFYLDGTPTKFEDHPNLVKNIEKLEKHILKLCE